MPDLRMANRFGRRRFLAVGAVGTAEKFDGASAASSIKITRGLYPQDRLLEQRNGKLKTGIHERRARKQSRVIATGVFQMRNHCAGQAGKEENLQRMLAAIDAAAREQVRILVFPEMCLPGYFTPISGTVEEAIAANRELADEAAKGRFLRALQDAAAKTAMVVAFGFAERSGDHHYDSVGVIDATGEWLGVRRKNPLYPWEYETRCFAQPPATLRSRVFETRYAKVGISCCFDGEFPESIRRMRLEGAEVLLWSNAALGDSVLGTSHRIVLAGAYAATNAMWVACANCAAPNSSGTSVICAPSSEPAVLLSPNEEAMGIADVDLSLNKGWPVWRDRLAL